jgi:heme O synthase-like polyprenyltransferase
VFHHAIRTAVPYVAPAVTPDQALSFAVVLHAMGIGLLVVLGAVGLLMLGVSLPDVLHRSSADGVAR